MTCIIALKGRHGVFVGADSQSSSSWLKYSLKTGRGQNRKIFRVGDMLIACAGSARVTELVQYKLAGNIASYPSGGDDIHAWMCTTFIDAARKTLHDGGAEKKENELETAEGGFLIVAFRGRIFSVYEDFQVLESNDPFCAGGSGESVAVGAIQALLDSGHTNEREIILSALKAAAKHSVGVGGPFTILSERKK